MTHHTIGHDELRELLAGYAIDALSADEAAAVADHLPTCSECRAELASLSEAVGALAGAVPQLTAPERLRDRVLVTPPAGPAVDLLPEQVQSAPLANRGSRGPRWAGPARRGLSIAAGLAIMLLSAGVIGLYGSVQGTRGELNEDRAALSLLTSTETTNDLLAPRLATLPADAHGHWFHRDGMTTQVLVGERLSPLSGGQRYVAWIRMRGGWKSAGQLQVDASGYGRLVVLGIDGADVTGVEITIEAGDASSPGRIVVLASQS